MDDIIFKSVLNTQNRIKLRSKLLLGFLLCVNVRVSGRGSGLGSMLEIMGFQGKIYMV